MKRIKIDSREVEKALRKTPMRCFVCGLPLSGECVEISREGARITLTGKVEPIRLYRYRHYSCKEKT